MEQTEEAGRLGLVRETSRTYFGWWFRGEARVMVVPYWNVLGGDLSAHPFGAAPPSATSSDVKVLSFGALHQVYPMPNEGRAALRELLALASDPSDAAVVAFARAFGPLVSFRGWLLAQLPTLLGGMPGLAVGSPADWRVGRLLFYFPDGSPYRLGADVDLYLNWLDEKGLSGDALYVEALLDRLRTNKGNRGSMRRPKEPLSFYVWMSEEANWVARELGEGRSGAGLWLDHRLGENSLTLADRHPARLGIRATTLIGYLVRLMLLGRAAALPEVRECQECGEEFAVRDGRQRFCCRRCQDTNKKRRQRREAAERRQRTAAATPSSAQPDGAQP